MVTEDRNNDPKISSSLDEPNKTEILEVESKARQLKGWQWWLVAGIAISASLFHLYTALYGLLPAMYQRGVHWMFMGVLLFLLYPISKGRPKNKIDIWDWCFAILLAIGCLNILINWDAISQREGMPTSSDIYLGVMMIILVIEGARRSMGWPLPIVAIVALIYALFGPYFPGLLGHGGFPLKELAPFEYLRTDGIFGVPLGVSASFIFLFVLFGAFLSSSGAGKFFIDLAVALTGRSQGGPGKAAVIASGLMGTVSGSSVANAVTTGAFTIPLMKQSGYKNEFAGAVVAAASTGGQVMPPVMGAAAFIMAQFLGVSYWEIVVAAAVPATLYFASIWFMVHFRSGRIGLQKFSAENMPKLKIVLKEGWHLLLPIVTLVIFLALGYSPVKAVFWSLVLLVVVSWGGKKEYRMTPKRKKNSRCLDKRCHWSSGSCCSLCLFGINHRSYRHYRCGACLFFIRVEPLSRDPSLCPDTHHDWLDHTRHGSADDGSVHYYFYPCCSCIGADGRSNVFGSPFLSLFWSFGRCHTTRCFGYLCRFGHS